MIEGRANWLGGTELACPSITDCDMDGVRAMYRAVVQRALHDACGATVVAPTQVEQMRFARDAWNFLYSPKKEHRDERWMVCELAQIDPEALELRMVVASIPEPTYDTLKHAWTNLELAYWRLGGRQGERPEARPERTTPEKRGDRTARRTAMGHRVQVGVPRRSARALTHGNRTDRRDAGLLFKGGVPVRPSYAGSGARGGIMSQLNFEFGANTMGALS